MLNRLSIENLALITNMELIFQPGLTVITGETGAGKSILVQAVEALLGKSVHAETVQTGSPVARVEGSFDISRTLVAHPKFLALQLNTELDQELRLTREIHRKGRDRFLINDQIVKKADFQWIGEQLLDVNSQHSHQYLLQSKNHLNLFDKAVNQPEKLTHIHSAWEQWLKVSSECLVARKKLAEMEMHRDLMEYQLKEINESGLRSGEKQELIEERERLRYAEDIRENLTEALAILDLESSPVTDSLARVSGLMEKAAQRDTTLTETAERCDSLSLLARDVSDEIQQIANHIVVSPERLNMVSDRLYVIRQLESKYKNSVEGILEYRDAIEEQLGGYSVNKTAVQDLEERCRLAREAYFRADKELSQFRRSLISETCRRLEQSLVELGMRHAEFDIQMESEWQIEEISDPAIVPDRCTAAGTDRMEFLLSANPGVPLKPLSMIASGGELSRIMLALKQHLIEADNCRTMVFDEIDTGIGGDIANAVGEKLRILSRDNQIFCITHLPQIAVQGQEHFRVQKQTLGDTTRIVIDNLKQAERVKEIARMLGNSDGKDALRHAESMLFAASRPNSG